MFYATYIHFPCLLQIDKFTICIVENNKYDNNKYKIITHDIIDGRGPLVKY